MTGDLEGAGLAPTHVALARRHIAAATIGNALEFYDFVTYAFFAIQIGRTFFPAHNAYASLMLSLATFGAGFVTRPIGGIIIGAYADRVGRRPAMMLSFTLMGAAIIALALIPGYKAIGVAAPILAVLARMVQGFSLGGEVGPTTAYLLEAAPLNRRALAVSWQGASQGAAAMTGGLVGAGLAHVMAPAALDAYGWRIAFLLGAATLPFGLWIRRSLPETLDVPEPEVPVSSAPTRLAALRASSRIIGLAFVVLAAGTISTYVFNYITTYAEDTLHMPPTVSFLADALGNGAGIPAVLIGGWLSDKIGRRRPLMIWPNLLNLILILPAFMWVIATRSSAALLVTSIGLGFLGSMPAGVFFAALAETLPKRIRGGAFGTVYAFAIAIFGGTTQLIVTWLIHVTGNPMSPAWYLLGASAIGQVALMLILESAPARARQPG